MGHQTAQTSRYELACEVGASLTSSLDLEGVLEGVARRIAEAVDVWECDLYEYYPDSETIVASAAWAREMTPEDREWVGTVWSLAERPAYTRVLLEGVVEESTIDDADMDPLDRELMQEWGELSTLSAPLRLGERVIGCLTLIEKRSVRRFDGDDKELVGLLALPAAAAIDNARTYHRQVEQERQLAALLDSTRALTSAVVLEDILSVVCREAVDAFDTGEAVIYEYDGQRETFVFRAIHQRVPTEEAEAQIGAEYSIDDRPGDREMLFSGDIVEDRVSDEGLDSEVRASMQTWGEKTCLNVPLLFEGDPVGELVLIESERERHFSDDELVLARAFGEQAAVAIAQARFYRRAEEQNRKRLALLQTSRSLAASLDPDAVIDAMRAELTSLFGLDEGAVSVSLGGKAKGAGTDGATDEAPPDGLARRALEARVPVQGVDDGSARLVAPLLVDDAAEGFVEVRGDDETAFTERDVELVQALAGQAAAALTNARLYRTVEQQAITDGLTGLFNHRHFYERLTDEFARAQRYGLPLSLLMLDIDDFKVFNDTYGHPAGDVVLAAVARVLAEQTCAGVDVVARYGGEEFAVLLPNTARDGAEEVGDRMVHEVAALSCALEPRPNGHADGARSVGEGLRRTIAAAIVPGTPGASVTVSVGVAAYPGAAGDPEELVASADKALYLAKRMGKNRVEAFGG